MTFGTPTLEIAIQVRLRLFSKVYPILNHALPTLEQVTAGAYGPPRGSLYDQVTLLRSDLKSLPISLQRCNFDEVDDAIELQRWVAAFDALASVFETCTLPCGSVDSLLHPEDASDLLHLPKLLALAQRRAEFHNTCVGLEDPVDDTNSGPVDASMELVTSSKLMVLGNTVLSQHHQGLACFVDFRRSGTSLDGLVQAIKDLVGATSRLAPGSKEQWNIRSQLAVITTPDLDTVREAHTFGKYSASLYDVLADCTCGAVHAARLHLSGFVRQQCEVFLRTCEQGWISASCIVKPMPLRSHSLFPQVTQTALRRTSDSCSGDCLDRMGIWVKDTTHSRDFDDTSVQSSFDTLDLFIGGLAGPSTGRPKITLKSLERKLIGVHLALSLFRLHGTPWLQVTIEGDQIYMVPTDTNNRLPKWRPHVACRLSSQTPIRSLSDDVAALGVLILELEARTLAGWEDDDEDYFDPSASKSNTLRLHRILKEWQDDLVHPYAEIGRACAHFDSLAEDLDDSKFDNSDKDLRQLMVFYKCILRPLYRKLILDFPSAEDYFQGTCGLSRPVNGGGAKPASTASLVLYDDEEVSEGHPSLAYSSKFLNDMDDGFLYSVTSARSDTSPSDFDGSVLSQARTRIAVLDTGLDFKDPIVRGARHRIIKQRSWIGTADDCTDMHGHGTHVLRLLLTMAPTAEIYVAKITDKQHVKAQQMGSIAQAIDWAVQDVDADIISMSFGFEEQHKEINAAIGRAYKADKLLFAAASNDGGNKPRSRPARSTQVICMHACDGKGNKGLMSPSPETNKDNFTTLGVGIKSRWDKKVVYKSGTSFATPIAAGIAASVMEFANFKCDLSEDDRTNLYRREGMVKVLQAMCTSRDGYDYINPEHLWHGKSDEDVARCLRQILDDL